MQLQATMSKNDDEIRNLEAQIEEQKQIFEETTRDL